MYVLSWRGEAIRLERTTASPSKSPERDEARQKHTSFASPAVGRCPFFYFWCEAASTAWPSPPRLLFRGSGLRCAILVSLPRSLPTTIQAPASLYLSRAEQSKACDSWRDPSLSNLPRPAELRICMSSSSLRRITALEKSC